MISSKSKRPPAIKREPLILASLLIIIDLIFPDFHKPERAIVAALKNYKMI